MKTRYLPAIALLLSAAFPVHGADSRPNIVIFFIDDMGYADPACFGNTEVDTPQIDALAQGGLEEQRQPGGLR